MNMFAYWRCNACFHLLRSLFLLLSPPGMCISCMCGVHVLANVGVWRVHTTFVCTCLWRPQVDTGCLFCLSPLCGARFTGKQARGPSWGSHSWRASTSPAEPPLRPWVLFLSRTFTVLQKASLIIMPFIFYKYPHVQKEQESSPFYKQHSLWQVLKAHIIKKKKCICTLETRFFSL